MGYSSLDCIFLLLALVGTNAVALFQQEDEDQNITTDALLNYQKYTGLSPSVEILTGEKWLHVVEEEYFDNTDRRSKRNLIPAESGSGWHSNTFTWRISSYSKWLSKSQVDDAAEQAFKMWSEAADIAFIRAPDKESSIVISFVDGALLGFHSFDRCSWQVIHTQSSMSVGFIDLNDDKEWTVNSSRGVNLLACLAHNIGHAIGMLDSKKDSDVMFGSYCQHVYDHKVTLSENDKSAARQLYGPATHSRGLTNDYEYSTPPEPPTHAGDVNEYATKDRSSLTFVFFFVGIFVGFIVLFAGLIAYMKIKQKTIVDKKSMDTTKDVYMAYMTDNKNSVYQNLQHSRPKGTDPNPIYHDIKETGNDYLTPIRQDSKETETHYTPMA